MVHAATLLQALPYEEGGAPGGLSPLLRPALLFSPLSTSSWLLQHAIADATVSRGHLDTLHDAHAAALAADVGHQGARESIGGASLLARAAETMESAEKRLSQQDAATAALLLLAAPRSLSAAEAATLKKALPKARKVGAHEAVVAAAEAKLAEAAATEGQAQRPASHPPFTPSLYLSLHTSLFTGLLGGAGAVRARHQNPSTSLPKASTFLVRQVRARHRRQRAQRRERRAAGGGGAARGGGAEE